MSSGAGCVLIVDDDAAVGKVLCAILRQDGLEALHVTTGAAALLAAERQAVDLVISDLRMPDMDGMHLLVELNRKWPEIPVILLTAHGTVQNAVEAMKKGARDFLMKPFERDDILHVVRSALQASEHDRSAVPSLGAATARLVGDSEAMQAVHATIARAAPSMATVLIRGESGTGKELVARALHDQSPRHDQPFIKVHCAALPDALLESELFGYEKGAFTGASTRKPGRVELASRGTLFLDEIGDVTPAMQVKLLRVLQDREYERLGGTQTLKADVRFIAATHRDLEAMMKAGQFREDLFYRLNVVPIRLPPLRRRPGDVLRLAVHFCSEIARINGKPGMRLRQDALSALAAEAWPGNVRQLENFIERLVILSDGPELSRQDVLRELGRLPASPSSEGALSSQAAPESVQRPPDSVGAAPLEVQMQNAEREALLRALKRSGNNRALAARILGVSRRTLYNKLERFGLV